MFICFLIAILGFAIFGISCIVTDRLLERRIKDIEEKMNLFVKRLDIPTIEDNTPTKIASLDTDICATCINDKGCVNCENYNLFKTVTNKYGGTGSSDAVNGLTGKDLLRNMDISETQENPIMKPVEKRKATGKLAELINEFNDLPCDEKIRKISDTRVEMEKEVWLEKACEWLKSYRQDTYDGTGYIAGVVNDKTIEDFKNYVKGELL